MSTMIIRTNSPAIAGTKYMLATEVGVAVGAVLAVGGLKFMKVSDVELKYELDPAKVAMILYVPGMVGVKVYSYFPLMSLVGVPIT